MNKNILYVRASPRIESMPGWIPLPFPTRCLSHKFGMLIRSSKTSQNLDESTFWSWGREEHITAALQWCRIRDRIQYEDFCLSQQMKPRVMQIDKQSIFVSRADLPRDALFGTSFQSMHLRISWSIYAGESLMPSPLWSQSLTSSYHSIHKRNTFMDDRINHIVRWKYSFKNCLSVLLIELVQCSLSRVVK